MPFDVRMPDGTIIKNVPDGTTQEDILERYAASQKQPVQAPKPTGFLDRFKGTPSWMQSSPEQVEAPQAAGGDMTNPMAYLSEAQKTEQGPAMKTVSQGVNRAVQVGSGFAKGAVINPVSAVAQVAGGETGRQFAEETQKSYEQQRKTAGAEGFDFAELIGAVASPVNRLVPGGPIVGAGIGAMLNPVTGRDLSFEDVLRGKAEQAATGVLFGAAAKTILPALRDGAQKILSSGGDLSPGQAFGGPGGFVMRTGEDILDTFKKFVGKETSSEQLNKAFSYVAINEALAPIGKTVPKASDDGFAMVNQGLKQASKAYETAFNKLGKVAPDEDLFGGFRNIIDDARNTLDPEDFNKFSAEVRKNVFNRFKQSGNANQITQGGPGTPAYEIDGKSLHNVKRYLQARLKNLENDTTELGTTRKGFYEDIMKTFTDFTHRVDTSGAIKAADTTWANMYRISDAAKKAAVNSGSFSPEQLMKAATTQTSTLTGGSGTGPLQQYAKEALKVIGKDKSENLTPSDLKNIGVATGLGYTGFFNPIVLAAATTVGLTAEALGKLALKNPELYMKFRDAALKQAGRGGMALTTPGEEE